MYKVKMIQLLIPTADAVSLTTGYTNPNRSFRFRQRKISAVFEERIEYCNISFDELAHELMRLSAQRHSYTLHRTEDNSLRRLNN